MATGLHAQIGGGYIVLLQVSAVQTDASTVGGGISQVCAGGGREGGGGVFVVVVVRVRSEPAEKHAADRASCFDSIMKRQNPIRKKAQSNPQQPPSEKTDRSGTAKVVGKLKTKKKNKKDGWYRQQLER